MICKNGLSTTSPKGWTAKELAKYGIKWPPPKGWLQDIEAAEMCGPVTVSYLPGREPVKKIRKARKKTKFNMSQAGVLACKDSAESRFKCDICIDLGFVVAERWATGARTVPCKCRMMVNCRDDRPNA